MITITDAGREQLVAIVKGVCGVEKIYLLGRTKMKRQVESIFAPGMPSCHYATHHYLLVLAAGTREMHEVQEQVEARCKAVMPVTAIAIRTTEFGNWVGAGHPFARRVAERALLLYDGTGTTFEPGKVTDAVTEEKDNRVLFNKAIEKVEEFMAGADLYKARKEYEMATFMLHQSAECLLRTALHLMTGYHCHTHSLDKLLRFTGLVLWGAPEIFGRWQSEKEAQFQLLQGAYIGARYRVEYKVPADEFDGLYGSVTRLQEHVRKVWVNRLAEKT